MKKLLLSLFIIPLSVSAQVSIDEPNIPTSPNGIAGIDSIRCDQDIFYGASFNNIYKFSINGNNVTNIGLITTYPGQLNGIAVASNIPGASSFPALYFPVDGVGDSLYYYDAFSWHSIYVPGNYTMVNGASYGNKLFFHETVNSIFGDEILAFDGSSVTSAYTLPSGFSFAGADLAIDGAGNIYLMVSYGGVDFFLIVSQAGAVISQIPIPASIPTTSANGMMIIGNTLYISYGASGSLPYTLLPVTLTSSSATPGLSMSFNFGTFDLASCNAGIVLDVSSLEKTGGISIYPNPSSGFFRINAEVVIDEIKVFDLAGKLMYNADVSSKYYEISLPQSGFYFIELKSGDDTFTQKIVVE